MGSRPLGITDHGNMYGVLDFYKACARDRGITPIIGTWRPTWRGSPAMSARCAGARSTTPAAMSRVANKLYYHLTLALAESNVQGYRNLLKLSSSDAYLEGYYYKPRAGLGACSSPVSRGPDRHHGLPGWRGPPGPAEAGNMEEAEQAGPPACRTSSARTTLFVEIAGPRASLRRSTGPTRQLIEIAKPAPRAAPRHQRQPLHPPDRRRGPRRPAVRADRGSPSTTPTGSSSRATEHYLKSAAEMRHLFSELPEACDNTLLDRRAGQRPDRVRQAAACRSSRSPGVRRE